MRTQTTRSFQTIASSELATLLVATGQSFFYLSTRSAYVGTAWAAALASPTTSRLPPCWQRRSGRGGGTCRRRLGPRGFPESCTSDTS
eukprot:10541376-Prorocentrum_lima.AAC.1